MDTANLPEDFKETAEFHGHICPGLLIGYRASLAALQTLGVERSGDEELTVVAENDSCSVDAFQWLLGTTFGKGNLKWLDHGKQVFTVSDRKQEKTIRLSFTGDRFRAKQDDGSMDREAFMQELLTRPVEDLFEIRELEFSPPHKAVIEQAVICDSCGEPVQKSKTVEIGQRVLCRPCAAKEQA